MKKLFDNKIFKIVTGIIKSFLVIVLVCYICIILIQRLNGNKSIMGYRFFTVVTASMKGVYDVNDVIYGEEDESQISSDDDN